ncbi:TPA: hypothetical protein VDV19_005237 [Pseudomonas aeruginosa]|uniref:hypothetical protein n=1 Tax=Pseudomonas aeruginosa TaxID=287 RepID=UPI001067AAE5|nr:hypothetical protein [Pseudomonas aeruginosa]TEB72279.1 hypothetical protein IPC1604_28220 [Pseudomonas aeruginosa]TEC15375.1 hypothetical protein IPC1599_30310 [Pseudomonas aeruginosa]HEP9154588.1 hypothetical protein [Pseudomonas aeruginosa]HEP9217983.1 hypothetical protein [Pseudomonas aeruginosa]HEP9247534.1 hypothetical protein [Pseudomonas aeruginosa]
MKPFKQQWLLLKHSIGIPIASAIGTKSYSAEQNPGFELVELKPGFIKARFIERFEFMESVNDPFGLADDILAVRYVYFDFTVEQINSEVSLVKVVRPPASLKSFVALLSQSLGFSFVIRKVVFDLWNIYEAMCSLEVVDRLYISKVIASQIPIANGAMAKVEIVSAHDAIADLKRAYGASEMRLDRFSMSARIAFEDEYLELSSNGSIYCSKGIDPILTSLAKDNF